MKKYIIPLILSVAFFLIQLLTLSDYGLNEDSPFHFLRGQAYLQFLTTGKDRFDSPFPLSPVLFIPGQRISQYKPNAWENGSSTIRPIANLSDLSLQSLFQKYQQKFGRISFYQSNAWSPGYFKAQDGPGHPPLSDILSALTNRIFYQKLNFLSDINSYHLYAVFSATLGLFFLIFFAYKNWGMEVAIFSGLILALYPIFFAESHFNIKDIPELSFYTLVITSFYFWIIGMPGQKRWFWIFTISTLLAFGTKLTAIFLPLILLVWLGLVWKRTVGLRPGKRLAIYAVIFILFNVGLFILLWPYLWDHPFQKILELNLFYRDIGSVDLRVEQPSLFLLPFNINLTGIILWLTTAPILTLIFFSVGFYFLIKEKKAASLLVLIWFLVPLLRTFRPGAEVFGSIRQYFEFLPAMAVIAGIGAGSIVQRAKDKVQSYGIFSSLRSSNNIIVRALCENIPKLLTFNFILLTFIFLLIPIIRLHPNQNIYFNELVGGPKGALSLGLLDWQASYDNPYHQAVNWLNQYGEKGARLAFLDGSMEAISPLWLRDDISLGSYFSGFNRLGEYIISNFYPKPPNVFAYLYLDRFLKPVYEVKASGVVLAKVWKNDHQFLNEGYAQFQTLSPPFKKTTGSGKFGSFWQVDLEKASKIVFVKMKIANKDCNKKDGLFLLTNYIVPQRVDQDNKTTIFYFPAEETSSIRFYGIVPNSCFEKGEIEEIQVLAK